VKVLLRAYAYAYAYVYVVRWAHLLRCVARFRSTAQAGQSEEVLEAKYGEQRKATGCDPVGFGGHCARPLRE